jgi:hypothetical protein
MGKLGLKQLTLMRKVKFITTGKAVFAIEPNVGWLNSSPARSLKLRST